MEVPSRISETDWGKPQKPKVMILTSLAEPGHSRMKVSSLTAWSQIYLSHDQSCSPYSNQIPPLPPCQTQLSSSSHNRVPLSICIAIGFYSPRRTRLGGSAYGFRILIFETKSIISRKYFMLTDSAWYRKPCTSSSWHKLNLQWYWSSTRSPVFLSWRDESFLDNMLKVRDRIK